MNVFYGTPSKEEYTFKQTTKKFLFLPFQTFSFRKCLNPNPISGSSPLRGENFLFLEYAASRAKQLLVSPSRRAFLNNNRIFKKKFLFFNSLLNVKFRTKTKHFHIDFLGIEGTESEEAGNGSIEIPHFHSMI